MGTNSQVIVVGAGVVGLSCAYFLSCHNFEVTVIDRDLKGDRASYGNAGALAFSEVLPIAQPGIIWKVPFYLFDPLGPLSMNLGYIPRLWPYLRRFLAAANKSRYEASAAAMSAFLATAFEDHRNIHENTGLGRLFSRRGHLWVYRSQGVRDASREWPIRRDLGYKFKFLSRPETIDLEPSLGGSVGCAVHTEDWATYSDPMAYNLGLTKYLQERGVKFLEHNVKSLDEQFIRTSNDESIKFDYLVIAAGAWSHHLAGTIGDYCPLETERGYNTTLPNSGISLGRMITFAEDHFVATPMSMGIRIGGAIEFAGLTAAPNFSRSKALLRLAREYFPRLNCEAGTEWMGHRPSTPDSLPVIDRASRSQNIIYAFGHGHLGLTASATTGRVVAEIVSGKDPSLDLMPFGIRRFSS